MRSGRLSRYLQTAVSDEATDWRNGRTPFSKRILRFSSSATLLLTPEKRSTGLFYLGVAGQVARLNPKPKRHRAGAMLGPSVEPRITAGLLDIRPGRRRLDRATATRRRSSGLPTSSSDLVQEILYASTPAPNRTRVSPAAADLLFSTGVNGDTQRPQDWRGPHGAQEEQSAGQYVRGRQILSRAVDAATKTLSVAAPTSREADSRIAQLLRLAVGDFGPP
jgi:hypothetical protein